VDSDFFRKIYPKDTVSLAIGIYASGNSGKTTKTVVKDQKGYAIGTSTPWYWTQTHGKSYEDNSILCGLSNLLHCDETQHETEPGNKLYIWALKCPKTKVLVAWHVSHNRTREEAEKLFRKAKRRFPVSWLPKEIRTDSYAGFYPAMMKVFNYEVKHDKFKSFEEHSNNEIECFFRCKKRLPKFTAARTAEPYLNIAMTGYNRIAEHEKLGKTPGELCNLEALTWRDLIKNGDDSSYED
jgi:hypothetical protein